MAKSRGYVREETAVAGGEGNCGYARDEEPRLRMTRKLLKNRGYAVMMEQRFRVAQSRGYTW